MIEASCALFLVFTPFSVTVRIAISISSVACHWDIENTTRVPVGDDLSYNEWFLKRILRAKAS